MSDTIKRKFTGRHKYIDKLSTVDERDYGMDELVSGKRPCAALSKREAKRLTASKLPKTYRGFKVPASKIFDQGSSGMCCACTIAMNRYIKENIQTKNSYLFSPAYIYAHRPEDTILSPDEEGMIMREAFGELQKSGISTWQNYKYYGSYKSCLSKYNKYKDALDKVAKHYTIDSYYACNTIDEIKQAIYSLGCCSIAIACHENYGPDWTDEEVLVNGKWVPMKWPEINFDAKNYPNDPIVGYHAMLAIGWTTKGLILINSWGEEWGKNGMAVLPYEYPIEEAWADVDNKVSKASLASRKKIIVPRKAKKKATAAHSADGTKNVKMVDIPDDTNTEYSLIAEIIEILFTLAMKLLKKKFKVED
jgi:hypothetical protein